VRGQQLGTRWFAGREWALQRRYMTLERLAEVGDNPNVRQPAVAA